MTKDMIQVEGMARRRKKQVAAECDEAQAAREQIVDAISQTGSKA